MKRHMSRRKRHMSRRKKTVIAVFVLIVLAVLSAVALRFFYRLERSHDIAPEGAGQALSRAGMQETHERLSEEGVLQEEAAPTIFYNGEEYVYNDRLTSLLIIGVDDSELAETASVRNKSQADLILLAVFDPDTEKCTLLQINRDTMGDFPMMSADGDYAGLTHGQLALSHTYGNGLESSCENTVYAVSRFLYDVTIDNYFALTMDAIPVLNDLVGGVSVKIEDNFAGVDDTLVQGETVKLTAENVENYVRARMNMPDDPSNVGRMRRQRTYMRALFDALDSAASEDAGFVLDAYAAIAGSLVTDCSVDELSDYADRFSGYSLSEIVTPEGETVAGEQFMEFHADEAALQKMVIDIFYAPAE